MFDAVNAVLDGPYRPFASKPASAPGASPEAAAIRAASVVALNEFPTQTAVINSAYAASIAAVAASPEAIADGIVVGEVAANAVLAARVGDHRNDPDLRGTRRPAAPARGSRRHPHSRIRRPRFFASSRPSGTTTRRASVPRSAGAPQQHLRGRLQRGQGRRSGNRHAPVPPSSPRRRSSGRHRQPRSGAPTFTNLASTMDLLTAARFEAIGLSAVTNSLIACLGCEVRVHVLASGDRHPDRQRPMGTPKPSRMRVDTLHHHAIPPRISFSAHHGRWRRPRVLQRVVRGDRSVPAGVQGECRRGSCDTRARQR